MSFTEEHSEAVVEFDDISRGYSTVGYSDEQQEVRLQHDVGDEGKDPATGIENLNVIPKSLRLWNIVACFFQFGQAGALLYLATEADFFWPLYVNFPAAFDDTSQANFGVPAPKEVASYSVTWLSGVFLGLSGLDHLLVSFPCCQQDLQLLHRTISESFPLDRVCLFSKHNESHDWTAVRYNRHS